MTSLHSELNIFATESARRNLVTAYRKSGLSQKVFCTQHDVKESTFKNWFYRYYNDPHKLDQLAKESFAPI